MPDEDPGKERHAEGLHQPVHEQRDADATDVAANPVQRGEVHLHQHRDDHHPDEQPDGHVDPRDLHATDALEHVRERLAGRDADDDAHTHPDAQIPLERAHWCAGGRIHRHFGLRRHV